MEGDGWRLLIFSFLQHKNREADESVKAEYEFFNYRETSKSVKESNGVDLEHLTPGMFGYSLTRPTQNQDFYYGVFDACRLLRSPFFLFMIIPGWLFQIGHWFQGKINRNFMAQAKSLTSLSKAGIPSPGPGFMKLPWNLAKSRAWQIGPACLSMSIGNSDS